MPSNEAARTVGMPGNEAAHTTTGGAGPWPKHGVGVKRGDAPAAATAACLVRGVAGKGVGRRARVSEGMGQGHGRVCVSRARARMCGVGQGHGRVCGSRAWVKGMGQGHGRVCVVGGGRLLGGQGRWQAKVPTRRPEGQGCVSSRLCCHALLCCLLVCEQQALLSCVAVLLVGVSCVAAQSGGRRACRSVHAEGLWARPRATGVRARVRHAQPAKAAKD